MKINKIIIVATLALGLPSCFSQEKKTEESAKVSAKKEIKIDFNADSAYSYIAKQYAQRTALLASFGAVLGFFGILPIIFWLSSIAREIRGGLLSEARFDAASWGLLCLIPVLAVVLSTLTARWTVEKTLRQML